MKKYLAFPLLAAMIGIAASGFPQDKPKPELKKEVALEIRNVQWQQAKLLFQMDQLKAQYAQLQQQSNANAAELKTKLEAAIEKSGLDAKKYDLNGDTLELTEKPPAPKPEEKKEEKKK